MKIRIPASALLVESRASPPGGTAAREAHQSAYSSGSVPLPFPALSSRVSSYLITRASEELPGVKIRLSADVFLRIFVPIMFVPILLASIASAGSHKHHVKQESPTDPGYVLALATVNHFLHAWQTGDIENGMVQLSNGLRRVEDADKVEQFFYDADADGNAKVRAFEIARGHGQPGRYTFPVVLIGIQGSRITRKVSELIVVETGKNDRVVDKLP